MCLDLGVRQVAEFVNSHFPAVDGVAVVRQEALHGEVEQRLPLGQLVGFVAGCGVLCGKWWCLVSFRFRGFVVVDGFWEGAPHTCVVSFVPCVCRVCRVSCVRPLAKLGAKVLKPIVLQLDDRAGCSHGNGKAGGNFGGFHHRSVRV